ncbi:hypothetical protein ABFA07_022609 [Porites harrisoni]
MLDLKHKASSDHCAAQYESVDNNSVYFFCLHKRLFHSVLSVYSQDDAKLSFFQLYGVYQAADKPDLSPGNELLHANAAPRG